MNLDIVKNDIRKNIGRKVRINVYGLRNRKNVYEGRLDGCYPNIFTVNVDGSSKSFTYSDVITGEVKIEYC